ncbi:MAG: hypothetical protein QOF15_4030 [Mycobacterium sp.]|nr:hypothetical protein [Mycobacterium sp.]
MATQRRLLSRRGSPCLCGPDIGIGSRAGRLKLTLQVLSLASPVRVLVNGSALAVVALDLSLVGG